MKQTKTALIMSFFSLIFCVCMLIGTTFAWYTDSVTSGKNKIQAGSLSVDLVKYNSETGKYISVNDQPIFNQTSFEPDEMQVVYLGVQNVGTLPLKYRITLEVEDNGLADALEYAIIDGGKAETYKDSTWEQIKAASGGQTARVQPGTFYAAQNGQLDEMDKGSEDNADYFALAVHMDANASSKYLKTDADEPDHSVTINVQVDATQLEGEVPTNTEAEGIIVTEVEGVDFDQAKRFHFQDSFNDIELKGKTISDKAVLDGSEATVNGNLILKPESGGSVAGTIQNFRVNGYIYVTGSESKSLTIRDCTAKGIVIDDQNGAKYTLNGNTFYRNIELKSGSEPANGDLFYEIHNDVKASVLVKVSKEGSAKHLFALNMENNTFVNTEGTNVILIQPAAGTTSYTSGGLTFIGNDFKECSETGTHLEHLLSIQGDNSFADSSDKALDLATQVFTRNDLSENTGLTVLFKNGTNNVKEYTYSDFKVSQKGD